MQKCSFGFNWNLKEININAVKVDTGIWTHFKKDKKKQILQ